MADGLIGAAPVGQPGTISGNLQAGGQAPSQAAGTVPGTEANQPQVTYVTSEQLNAAMDRIERLVQSSTDKSYNRVQKMIDQMKQAGIQNPTADQARAMLAATGQSEQQEQQPEAQKAESLAASPEAEAWIKANGGDVTKDYWNDIYDAAQEAGVPMITRDDPEYTQFFLDGNGQMKVFPRARQFVRAFEQAFEAKKQRVGNLGGQTPTQAPGTVPGNLASSPGLGSGGAKNNFRDPKKTDRMDLIRDGLRETRRR